MSPAANRPVNHPSTRALLHAMLRQTGRLALPAAVAVAATVPTQPGHALDRTWIGGNTVWTDGVGAANWSPADEPDADDRAIFNTANAVDMGSNNVLNGLLMSNGIDLFTQTFSLDVNGDVSLSGASTNLNLGGNNLAGLSVFSGLQAEDVTINSGARINLGGNRLLSQATVGESVIVINAGGTIFGNGLIQNNDAAAATFTMLRNDGTLSVGNYSTGLVLIGGTPAARTLTISAFDSIDARVDLDGAFGNGVVTVGRNQTLDNNVQLSDSFDGTINLFQDSVLDMPAWTMSGGLMNVDNGAIAASFPFSATPAGPAFVRGGTMTQTGGTIDVVDADGELVFDAAFTGNGGTIDVTSGGTVRFNANSTLNNGHTLNMGANGQLIIDNDAVVTVNDDDFDLDGTGGADLTIRNGAIFNYRGVNLDGGAAGNIINGDIIFQDDDNNAATGGDQIFDFDLTAVGGTVEFRTVRAQSGVGRIRSGNDNAIMGGTVVISAGASMVIDAPATFSGAGSVSGASGSLFFDERVTIGDDTTITVQNFDFDNGNGELWVTTGATLTLNATNIETANSLFRIAGGRANVSTAAYNFGTGGELRFVTQSGSEPVYDGAGTVTFLSGSTLSNFATAAIFDSDAIFREGSTVVNRNSSARLTLGASGETLTFDGGDISELAAGSRVTAAGAWVVTGDSSIAVTTFDWDGIGTHVTTVNSGGSLNVNVGQIDLADDRHDGTINMNGGTLTVQTAGNSWTSDGQINSNGGGSIFGSRVFIGNDAGTLDADINVNSGTLNIGAPATFNSDADVFVAAGATLLINNANTIFTPQNGAANAEFTGSGTLRIVGAQFDEVTTLNMTGGTVGLDGSLSGNGGLTILTAGDTDVNNLLTINAATFDPFGFSTVFPFFSQSEINIADTARLTVNLDSPTGKWQVLGNGIINYAGNNTVSNFLAGSRLDLDGTLNVTGDGQTLNELEIGGTINLLTAGEGLTLAATNNEINGGTINGPGVLRANPADTLVGNGVINSDVDFNGTAYLEASGGLLDMNGSVLDVGTLRTVTGGVFDLANALNTAVTDSGLILNGGRFQGANITLASGDLITGVGEVLNNVNNNGFIRANGGTLTVNSSSDWDGSGENGTLQAFTGSLILSGSPGAQAFSGTATLSAGTLQVNGFALNMDGSSTLNMSGNSLYFATVATSFSGAINVSAGLGEISSTGALMTFNPTANVSLTGDLELDAPSRITAGASFSGAGSLINASASTMRLDSGASVGVLLTNEGTLDINSGSNAGVATVQALELTNGSVYNLDVNGTGLAAFDRLTVSSTAILDGILDVDFGFAASLGQTFTFLTGLNVSGAFDAINVSGLAAGLDAIVNVTGTAAILQIINDLGLAGDYNDNGSVEQGDLDLVLNNWGGPRTAAFVANTDGFATLNVDQEELDRVLNNWGSSNAPSFAGFAVPEPGMAALALGLAGLSLRRRRVA